MTDREALLRAVIARPDDDAPRLAFADWCREHGDAERADLIEVGCDSARHRIATLAEHERALALLTARRLAAEYLPPAFGPVMTVTPETDGWLIPVGVDGSPGPAFRVRRGFVAELRCAPADWEAHAAHFLAAAPVRDVWLAAWPAPETGYPPHERFSLRVRGGPWWQWRHTVRAGESPAESLYKVEWPGITFHFPPYHDDR
jgi:uncharacterized protein (TIGR02996 family)